MRLLFDLGHPAHVHLFKNFIQYLNGNGHSITVTSREKDITLELLDHYGIPHIPLSRPQKKIAGRGAELIKRDLQIFKLHKKLRFEAAFGTSVSIAHLTKLFGVHSYCFSDDDDRVIPLYAFLTYPFATKIINPMGLEYSRWKNKRILYNSYQKLAYLHPNNFQPDPKIVRKYGLKPNEYILVRNSSLEAHHDLKSKGISENLFSKILNFINRYTVVYSRENKKESKIDIWDMHHILAFAKLLITDSQSMTVEAAVLGAPNIRYNSFAGKISCLEELEKKYGLTKSFKPGSEEGLLQTIQSLLNDGNLIHKWKGRRKIMLSEKEDFNSWMIDFFEQEVNRQR